MKEFWKKILKAFIVLAILLSIVFVASIILALGLKRLDDKLWEDRSAVDNMYLADAASSDSTPALIL